ncbi:ankyrin [Ascobolus immersus RN42]|uniref:Ankyrin n=1 Tax=Ascobolus immersus RN42 TaxID=1160509 RepID=A0A3N4IEJ3_ASCIM|nr:ankyrin [Ascobolus immersus RN42]
MTKGQQGSEPSVTLLDEETGSNALHHFFLRTPIPQQTVSNLMTLLEAINFDIKTINSPNNEGATPLVLAISSFRAGTSDLDLIKTLLDHGAQVNKLVTVERYPGVNTAHLRFNCSALHKAVQKNDACLVRMLLRYGAYPGLRNDKGRTPIHYAAKYGLLEVLEELLKGRTLKMQHRHVREKSGYLGSELSHTGMEGYLEHLDSWPEAWVDTFDAEGDAGSEVGIDADQYDRLEEATYSIDPSNRACCIRYSKKVFDIKDQASGMTAISLACSSWKKARRYRPIADASQLVVIVRRLIESGADARITDSDGRTSLMLVCSNDGLKDANEKARLELVKLLIDSGVDADEIDYHGRTALMEAVQHGSGLGIVQYLLKHTDRPFALDSEAKSALHYALESRDDKGQQSVTVLAEPRLLLGEFNYVDGYPMLVQLAMETKPNNDHFWVLLRESGTANGRGVFNEHRYAFITLQRLLLNWVHRRKIGTRLNILRNHLTENIFEELLNFEDQHGWTGHMCIDEQQRDIDPAAESDRFPQTSLHRPTAWSSVWKHRRISIEDTAGLVLTCYSEGIALANHPFLPASMEKYNPRTRYFEIEIQAVGYTLAIGIIEGYIASYSGNLAYSNEAGLAWHSDDGNVYRYTETDGFTKLGELRVPCTNSDEDGKVKFTKGDVVGVGVDEEQRIFFTKNGTLLSLVAPNEQWSTPETPKLITAVVKGQIYPAVNLDREGRIEANFGGDLGRKPLRFNFGEECLPEDFPESLASSGPEGTVVDHPAWMSAADGIVKVDWEASVGWGC